MTVISVSSVTIDILVLSDYQASLRILTADSFVRLLGQSKHMTTDNLVRLLRQSKHHDSQQSCQTVMQSKHHDSQQSCRIIGSVWESWQWTVLSDCRFSLSILTDVNLVRSSGQFIHHDTRNCSQIVGSLWASWQSTVLSVRRISLSIVTSDSHIGHHQASLSIVTANSVVGSSGQSENCHSRQSCRILEPLWTLWQSTVFKHREGPIFQIVG